MRYITLLPDISLGLLCSASNQPLTPPSLGSISHSSPLSGPSVFFLSETFLEVAFLDHKVCLDLTCQRQLSILLGSVGGRRKLNEICYTFLFLLWVAPLLNKSGTLSFLRSVSVVSWTILWPMTSIQYWEEENSYENQKRWEDLWRWNPLSIQHFDGGFKIPQGNAFLWK